MRAVIQRVKSASVRVDNKIISSIDKGYLIFIGVEKGDAQGDVDYITNKVVGIRIFEDENDKMNLSIQDVSGEIIIVSQFTLAGDARKGRRPSFSNAMLPDEANELYVSVINSIKENNIKVYTGEFGAHMNVELINDGPVTILLDSKKGF